MSNNMMMVVEKRREKKPVRLVQMYVCGNLHRIVYEALERDESGVWQFSNNPWFDSMAQAVVWAFVEGRRIDNWEESDAMLGFEAGQCEEWYAWLRRELLKLLFPPLPPMLECRAACGGYHESLI